MMMEFCPCNSNVLFSECCDPIIKGEVKAQTAEKLMRSRYSAYTISAIEYLITTTHSSQRNLYSPKEMEKWAKESNWQKLEIIHSTENTVEFKAYFLDLKGDSHVHYEKSTFVSENGEWYYLDGVYE